MDSFRPPLHQPGATTKGLAPKRPTTTEKNPQPKPIDLPRVVRLLCWAYLHTSEVTAMTQVFYDRDASLDTLKDRTLGVTPAMAAGDVWTLEELVALADSKHLAITDGA